MRRVLWITILLSLSAAHPLAAQVPGNRIGLSQPSLPTERGRPQFAMPRDGNESYWKEGGAVTALITVIAMNIWARDASSKERLFGSLVLGGVFFVPGALIGGQIPKNRTPQPHAEP